MANSDPSKTEKPTPKKLSEARDKGDLATSQDTTAIAALLAAAGSMVFALPMYRKGFYKLFSDCFRGTAEHSNWSSIGVRDTLIDGSAGILKPMALQVFCISIISLLALRFQVGSYFSTKTLKWKFDSINPAKGYKNIMPSKDNLAKFLFTFSKVAIIITVCTWIIRGNKEKLMLLMRQDPSQGMIVMFELAASLAFKVILFFGVVAAFDIWWKKKQHIDRLMMTKQEIKDEHKNAEGDPKIKAKIRAKMRQMASTNLRREVKKAAVVLVNPTHVSVVLKYEPGDAAPQVVCKGLRKRALLLRKIAKEEGIPIIEAPPLARALYRAVPDGGFIEDRFFKAVATILAKLFRNKKKKRPSTPKPL